MKVHLLDTWRGEGRSIVSNVHLIPIWDKRCGQITHKLKRSHEMASLSVRHALVALSDGRRHDGQEHLLKAVANISSVSACGPPHSKDGDASHGCGL